MTHCLGGDALAQWHLTFGMTHRFGAQHETGEVECPFVQFRNVRAVHVTQLALEAFVDNLILLGNRESAGILIVVLVDVGEKCGE